jgi:hypothetical protein
MLMGDKQLPNKIKVEKVIYHHPYDGQMKWEDIKHLELEDDDMIVSQWVEPYYSENDSWDGHWEGQVIRMVEETDDQFERRTTHNKLLEKWAKESRYENYLRLKKEFENGESK